MILIWVLRKLRVSYPNNVIIGHLNINSIRNKFEMLQFLLADYIDILMISESKLDSTFPSSLFQIYGLEHLIDWIEPIEEEEYYCL